MDDWRLQTQTQLSKSKIFQNLEKKCLPDAAGKQVLALVDDAVYYAYQRTKTVIIDMGEFTLHDSDHLFRVLFLMERLLSEDQIEELSIPELMLLVLSAFFHDIGMAPDKADIVSWKKVFNRDIEVVNKEEEKEFHLFQKFYDARPEQLSQIENFMQEGDLINADLAKDYLISEYIRSTHAERSREIIQREWSEKIRYRDTDLTVEFAAICYSHNEDAIKVLELDKDYLCGPETIACLPLVATVLRLSDLLDFDAKRTPSILFAHLFVRHPISILEWNKHRSVEAWTINNNKICFQVQCNHPAIQSAIHSFCDLIDQELSACNNNILIINEFNKSINRNIVLKLPFKVDRTKIQTKKMINGEPKFIYRETQFNLSKRQVIDLLMGTKLYGDPEVALRELIQNSIDACLLRQAMELSWGNSYIPEIQIKYYTDGNDDILEVVDNGIGMDQNIIDKYYTKIGTSFYKSSDFYDLRSQSNAKFIPRSRFGIGILSSFMVADTLIVDTRKVYAPHDSSDPINLTVEGQESIFWIKPGERKTPGTTTKLILRKQRHPWEKMSDSQFIKSVEHVVRNPPFKITITSKLETKDIDQNSFKEVKIDTLKDHTWNKNENIREFDIEVNNPGIGLVGSVIVAILESKGMPADRISMTEKSIKVENVDYNLKKTFLLEDGKIKMESTSISIDEEGNIKSSNTSTRLSDSESRISLHGIEVPSTLFPYSWDMQRNQVQLDWPLPVLLVIDVCGQMDLDLNSARTQILLGEKWNNFEEVLAKEVFSKISNSVEKNYWDQLKSILIKGSKNEILLRVINEIHK